MDLWSQVYSHVQFHPHIHKLSSGKSWYKGGSEMATSPNTGWGNPEIFRRWYSICSVWSPAVTWRRISVKVREHTCLRKYLIPLIVKDLSLCITSRGTLLCIMAAVKYVLAIGGMGWSGAKEFRQKMASSITLLTTKPDALVRLVTRQGKFLSFSQNQNATASSDSAGSHESCMTMRANQERSTWWYWWRSKVVMDAG